MVNIADFTGELIEENDLLAKVRERAYSDRESVLGDIGDLVEGSNGSISFSEWEKKYGLFVKERMEDAQSTYAEMKLSDMSRLRRITAGYVENITYDFGNLMALAFCTVIQPIKLAIGMSSDMRRPKKDTYKFYGKRYRVSQSDHNKNRRAIILSGIIPAVLGIGAGTIFDSQAGWTTYFLSAPITDILTWSRVGDPHKKITMNEFDSIYGETVKGWYQQIKEEAREKYNASVEILDNASASPLEPQLNISELLSE